MGYCGYLQQLLRPLGVYRLEEGSFSGGELAALGAALDLVWETMQDAHDQSLITTAGDAGLSRWEALLPWRSAAKTLPERRAAVAGCCGIREDGITLAAMNQALAACGLTVQVREGQKKGTVEVWFPGLLGEPAALAQIQAVAEQILPCHLEAVYRFSYCPWQTLEDLGLTWGQLEGQTWLHWMNYGQTAD